MDSVVHIFLLTPKSSNENKVKIIWADSDEDARNAADPKLLQRITSNTIPLLEDGIYSHETTLCGDITSEVTDLTESNNSIHFIYDGVEVSLTKGYAQELAKFIK